MRPDDPELGKLLKDFVTVRLTSLKGVDLNRFVFDYDLTFAVLMTDPDGRVYSRFGTRDENDGLARMSIQGLKNAMKRVLDLHRIDRRAAAPEPKQPARTAADFAAFASTPRAGEDCYHCHYATDARFMQMQVEGQFSKKDLFQYPHPENIGLTLDVDRNNVVRSVAAGHPAAAAGVRPGDVIVRAGDINVLTAADLQFALDPVSSPGSIELEVERDGRLLPKLKVVLPAGWRRSDISWRPSQGAIPPIIGIWEEPLSSDRKGKLGLPQDQMALRVSFLFPGDRWVATRGDLRLNDVIIDVDNRKLPHMTPRQFHSWFRLNKSVGESAVLQVLRDGRRIEVTIPCLDVAEF